jgi:hypothetical protein
MSLQNTAAEMFSRFISLACLAGAVAAPAMAQEPPPVADEFYSGPPEIVLYEGPNFTGRSLTLNAEAPQLSHQRFHDRASSVRVIAGSWRLCEHPLERGYCRVVTQDIRQLGRLNDQISSVTQALRGPGGGDPGPRPGGESITFYSGVNYTGRSITLTGPEPDFRRLNFNDAPRSLRYSGGGSWRACQHFNYEGACFEITGDIRDLAIARMAGEISSAAPDSGFGNGPRTGIWLYDGVNFGGQRVDISRDIGDLSSIRFNDRADSLVVAAGESWELCEHANRGGRCEVFQGGAHVSLYSYRLGNNVSSAVRVDFGGGYGGGYGRTRVTGGIEGITTTFFPVPEINGRSVDRCLASGRDCDTVAADAICRAAGHQEAAYFTVDRARRYRTTHLGSGRLCTTGRCEAILDVLCIN